MSDKELITIDVNVTVGNIEEKSYACNKIGCLQKFNSEKSLKKHLSQHYGVLSKDESTRIHYRFSCPIKTCRRSLKMDSEYFTSRKHLFQHYYKVHDIKKFSCSHQPCDKKFSTEMLLNLHLKNCGRTFTCHCECAFNSKEALLTHQKRKHPTFVRSRKEKVDKSVMSVNNNDYSKKKKSDNPPTTREVSTTTSGLGLWNSRENLSFPAIANTTSVFTSTDQPISSTSFESKSTSPIAPKLINSSTSTAEDFTKEENSNSLSSSSSQNNKKTLNWNSVTGGDFDDSLNLFDNDVKMELYSAETQTDFTENLFNNNYTQTNFADFYDFEKFDIETQTNWDEWQRQS